MEAVEAIEVAVTEAEWRSAATIASFCHDDERLVMGNLLLEARDGRRTWWAGDGRLLASEAGEPDGREYRVLVPPRTVAFVARHGSGAAATVRVAPSDDGPVRLEVETVDRTFAHPADLRPYPDMAGIVTEAVAADGGRATVPADTLRTTIASAAWRPYRDDEVDEPLCWMTVADGSVSLEVDWPGLGPASFRVPATTDGVGMQPVPPAPLAAVVDDLRGDVEVLVPTEPHRPLVLRAGDSQRFVLPIDTSAEVVRADVETALMAVFGHAALERDNDGDYQLSAHGTPVYARLVDDGPFRLEVFAVVLAGVEPSADLHAELNDYNARLGFCRTFQMGDQVLAECDLVATTLDREELVTAYQRVRSVAAELGPVLAAAFGGSAQPMGDEHRWSHYRRTVVRAELAPGRMVALTGPEAVDDLAFDEPVHVLTAWNPGSRRRSAEKNVEANAALAAALVEADVGFVRAVGAEVDGDHAEPGFLVWGLGRNAALAIGRQFGQDAVWELTDGEVSLVASDGDRVETVGRRELGAGD